MRCITNQLLYQLSYVSSLFIGSRGPCAVIASARFSWRVNLLSLLGTLPPSLRPRRDLRIRQRKSTHPGFSVAYMLRNSLVHLQSNNRALVSFQCLAVAPGAIKSL